MTYLQELNDQDMEHFIIDEDEDITTTSELFSISSYGIDYPVETLVNRINNEQFYVPSFQRGFVWSKNRSSRFIESLLLGLPVPGIFLYKETETGKHLIIDGQQRLLTLTSFFQGEFNTKKFNLSGIDSKWEGKTFETLTKEDQMRLADTAIHVTVFKQDLPRGNMNSVYEVFERLNTGGVKLSAQEIRSCIFHGNFNDFLHKLNKQKTWRSIFRLRENNRLKDVEIILRFFAFLERKDQYSPPMKQFLNNFMATKRNYTDKELIDLEEIFITTMDFIATTIGDHAFRPEKAFNVAVFDSVATTIAKKIKEGGKLCEYETKTSYMELLENHEFREGYLTNTASTENVNKRFLNAGQAFGLI